MGRARRGDSPEIVKLEDIVVGVNFGWEHCAEHEWGIKDIQHAFGIPTHKEAGDTFGIDRRRVTKVPPCLLWYTTSDGDGFVYDTYLLEDANRPDWTFSEETRIYGDALLGAAWAERSFQIKSIDEEVIAALKEVFQALENKNAVIALMGSPNPFSNSGFTIFIADRLPQEVLDNWYAADEEVYELEQEWKKATEGLIEKMDEKGLGTFFLGNPKRTKRRGDEGEVLVGWLNPMEQKLYRAGWYTPEELFSWAEDPENCSIRIKADGA